MSFLAKIRSNAVLKSQFLHRKESRFYCKPREPHKVVFVRHGQSEWNKENRFCGWHDAKLTDEGRNEARVGARDLLKMQFTFDCAYSSVLLRSMETLEIILQEMGLWGKIPHIVDWRLNERHYGNLTGLNKVETAKKYGQEQVKLWRRSFDVRPPEIEEDNPYFDKIIEHPRYLHLRAVPKAEALKDTVKRVVPFWNEIMIPAISKGQRALIVGHGNSLRGIVKHLDNISDKDIVGLNIPTGIPFVYELDQTMKPLPGKSLQFVGDAETVRKAMAAVRKQTEVPK